MLQHTIKKKAIVIALLISCAGLLSFFQQQPPKEQLKKFYTDGMQQMLQQLIVLRETIQTGKDTAEIHKAFLQARLAYKHIEPIIEYYFDGDVKLFNGLATNFIEEEDPAAYQEPQGFQAIESLIYPEYDPVKKNSLLLYADKLINTSKGLASNPRLFNPQELVPDALMEELYRILALGIAGFDSPIAKLSISEAEASLQSVKQIMEIYQSEWQTVDAVAYRKAQSLLPAAITYIQKHPGFDSFNRMEFILSFLNPITDAVASIKIKTGNKENSIRYTLIKKTGNLFQKKGLNQNLYLYDDRIIPSRVALGKKLFYEPLLSVNGKRSCGSCHLPNKAFTDGLPKALQLDGHSTLPRNTPTLWNASLQMNLFYDSRHVKLEDVVMEVLGNEKEMNSGAAQAIRNLSSSAQYKMLFNKAYAENDNAISEKNAANAIASYIRTLISYQSRFDRYMRGEKNTMNANEIQGFNLFMGKAKCGTCHYAPLFNGSKPPTYYYQESEVLGVPANTDTLRPQLDTDPGRMATLKIDFMDHAFKTPTLRNIELTAPYMHNGVYRTLDDVIDFYNKGGGQGLGLSVPNQTLPADKLALTATEKKQLKAFLLTLTDTRALH